MTSTTETGVNPRPGNDAEPQPLVRISSVNKHFGETQVLQLARLRADAGMVFQSFNLSAHLARRDLSSAVRRCSRAR